MKGPTYYVVEQGMANPRDPGEISYRHWGMYSTKGAAMTAAKKVGAPVRVIECTQVWANPPSTPRVPEAP